MTIEEALLATIQQGERMARLMDRMFDRFDAEVMELRENLAEQDHRLGRLSKVVADHEERLTDA